MRRAVLVIGVVATLFLALGCSRTPAVAPPAQRAETAQQIASRLKLTLTGQLESTQTVIPQSLDQAWSSGAWYYYQVAALQGGYDLHSHAGESVTLRAYGIRETSEGHRQRLWVIESGSKVIGAYIAVDDVVPGISGVGNPS